MIVNSRYNDGDYILLHWQGKPEWYAVKGMLKLADAAKIVSREEPFDVLESELELVGYLFARFEPAPRDYECKQILKLHSTGGRGAFRVTILALKGNPLVSKPKN